MSVKFMEARKCKSYATPHCWEDKKQVVNPLKLPVSSKERSF